MLIRSAVTADRAEVERIVLEAYAPYVERIGRAPGPMLDDYAARIAAHQVWVAGEPITGILVLEDQADHLLLDNIAVAGAARGQGVGRALLGFADAEAQRRGFSELRLYTHQKMTENIALYARSGWEETGRGVQNGFPRVFFRRRV